MTNDDLETELFAHNGKIEKLLSDIENRTFSKSTIELAQTIEGKKLIKILIALYEQKDKNENIDSLVRKVKDKYNILNEQLNNETNGSDSKIINLKTAKEIKHNIISLKYLQSENSFKQMKINNSELRRFNEEPKSIIFSKLSFPGVEVKNYGKIAATRSFKSSIESVGNIVNYIKLEINISKEPDITCSLEIEDIKDRYILKHKVISNDKDFYDDVEDVIITVKAGKSNENNLVTDINNETTKVIKIQDELSIDFYLNGIPKIDDEVFKELKYENCLFLTIKLSPENS